MGATLSTESVLTAAVLIGALGAGYHQYTATPSADTAAPSSSVNKKKKKGSEEKKTAGPPAAAPQVHASSTTLPGQFDDPSPPASSSSKPRKVKKKKKPSTPESTPQPTKPSVSVSTQRSHPSQQSTTSIDTDGSWTRVEARKKLGKGGEQSTGDVTASDAGITSSLTENSSPVEEESMDKRTTLAEKLVPKPAKTDVDDMLPGPPTLSRVMRVKPLPNEKPAPGFTWGDYEEFQGADGEGNDADGEDDGWGVVNRKRSRPTTDKRTELPVAQQAPEALTKKQRQNANKREAQKSTKAAAEAERLAVLAKHKRELERIRIMEQSQSSKKGKMGGGMTSVVDDRGKLVWE